MKHIFGPVNSRRLGLSLGIDLLPPKICSFNCIYCEVGPTTRLTCERREYIRTDAIIAEIEEFLTGRAGARPFDVLTITASGEPTLHSGIGEIIRHIKNRTGKPVAVLTNGSMLNLPGVRRDLRAADIVIPSLDAAEPAGFRKINRPAPGLELKSIIDGLAEFSGEYKGHLWLEILLAAGINDGSKEIDALRQALAVIKPEKIQLNTVARPPAEDYAGPLSHEDLEDRARRLGGPIEIIADFHARPRYAASAPSEEEIVQILERRPGTITDICEALNQNSTTIAALIKKLVSSGRLKSAWHHGKNYYHLHTSQ